MATVADNLVKSNYNKKFNSIEEIFSLHIRDYKKMEKIYKTCIDLKIDVDDLVKILGTINPNGNILIREGKKINLSEIYRRASKLDIIRIHLSIDLEVDSQLRTKWIKNIDEHSVFQLYLKCLDENLIDIDDNIIEFSKENFTDALISGNSLKSLFNNEEYLLKQTFSQYNYRKYCISKNPDKNFPKVSLEELQIINDEKNSIKELVSVEEVIEFARAKYGKNYCTSFINKEKIYNLLKYIEPPRTIKNFIEMSNEDRIKFNDEQLSMKKYLLSNVDKIHLETHKGFDSKIGYNVKIKTLSEKYSIKVKPRYTTLSIKEKKNLFKELEEKISPPENKKTCGRYNIVYIENEVFNAKRVETEGIRYNTCSSDRIKDIFPFEIPILLKNHPSIKEKIKKIAEEHKISTRWIYRDDTIYLKLREK